MTDTEPISQSDFETLLEDAASSGRISPWERNFVEDIARRNLLAASLTVQQIKVIRQIERKVYAIG